MKRAGIVLIGLTLCVACAAQQRVKSAKVASAEAKAGELKGGGTSAAPARKPVVVATPAAQTRTKPAAPRPAAQTAPAPQTRIASRPSAAAPATAPAHVTVKAPVTAAAAPVAAKAPAAPVAPVTVKAPVAAAAPVAAKAPVAVAAPSVAVAQSRSIPAQENVPAHRGPAILALAPHDTAVLNIALRFRTGAVDDPPGKAGLTQLAAQVMTEGGTQSLDAKALIDALFPIAAELSVRVDKEETTFNARVHRDALARLLPILTDVVLHPRWDEKEFSRIRDSTVNDVEKRLRQGDDENLGKQALAELIYRNHPYGRLTEGHAGDLQAITLAEAKAQAAKFFTQDRLTIGVSGGYPAGLPRELKKTLAALPRSGPPATAIPQAQPAARPRFLLIEKPGASTAISMGMPWTLSHSDADWAAMSIARSAMGEHRQFNGRLMARLRELRGLNYGDYAYIEHFEQQGGDAATAQLGRARHQQDFTVWLRPVQNDNRLFAVRAALVELQHSLKDEPFSAAEVEQTKGFLDGYILLFDQTDQRKLGYALDDSIHGMSGFLPKWRSALRDVTADEVNAAWRKWVNPGRLQIVMVGPDMAALKREILANHLSPMHYQTDAQGNVPPKPKELLDADAVIEKFPLGAPTDADVQVIQADRMFE